MSAAIDAKNARARAAVAVRLLKRIKPWPVGWGLGCNREFGHCFMMGDGDEVLAILLDRARRDPSLLAAMRVHSNQCGHWVTQIEESP